MSEIIEEWLKKGKRSQNLGNPKESMRFFAQILKIKPDHLEALVRYGNILGKIGKYQEAIIYYEKAINQDSENVLAWLNKGLAHHFLKDYESAIDSFDFVLMKNPSNKIAMYQKASSLILKGEINHGLKILKDLIKMDYSFKAKAKLDIDFQEIKNKNSFKKIIL